MMFGLTESALLRAFLL